MDARYFDGLLLEDQDFRKVKMDYSRIRNTTMRNICMVGSSLRGAMLESLHLMLCDLSDACLQVSTWHDVVATGCRMRSAGSERITWSQVRLYRSELTGAAMTGSEMTGCVMDADWSDACLRWSKLRGCVLDGSCMRGVDLFGSLLEGVSLRWVDLRGADLRGITMRGCDLTHARVTEEQLVHAGLA